MARLAAVVVTSLALMSGCQETKGSSGAKGDPGPKGDQGAPGPQGLPGQVIVLAAADGGSMVVDGGLVIVSGPPGPPGAVVVLNAADGGTIEVSGGVAYVVGPAGIQGASGAQGPAGIPGAQGPQGQPGAQGSAGAPGSPGQPGPLGPSGPAGADARLVYLDDTSSPFSDAGVHLLYSAVVPLPVWSTTGPAVVETFTIPIPSTTATTLIHFEGDALSSSCSNGGGAGAGWSGALALFIKPTGGGATINVGGITRCNHLTTAGNLCDDGFVFKATIPAGALPVGTYQAEFQLGQACTTTMYPGGAAYSVGHAITQVTQYP